MESRKFSGKVSLAAGEYGKERDYWLNKFSGELVLSAFPRDYRKPAAAERKAEFQPVELPGELSARVLELSQGLDHRLHMVLLAAAALLTGRYAGTSDIVVGMPINKQEMEGEFINTVLALRLRLRERMTFKEFLLEAVRPTVLEAVRNQNYPIETLLYRLNMPCSNEQCPLFDMAVLLENIHHREYLRPVPLNLIFSFSRHDEDIRGTVEYNGSLYRAATVERIRRHFISLLRQVTLDIDARLEEIDILGEAEKRQLLYDFNDTRTSYPRHRTIDALFEEQAAGSPHRLAVCCGRHTVTYRALNERADRLAGCLGAMGSNGGAVGIMAEYSVEMVVGLLAILKTGGSYLPINDDYPPDRKKYLMADADASLLLTTYEAVDPHFREVIRLQDPAIYDGGTPRARVHGGTGIAYIIYTSGSTGNPKGTLVEHRSVIRLVRNTDYVDFIPGQRLLQTGALEFDASTFEIWGTLLNGLVLVLISRESILAPDQMREAILMHDIGIMWMTSPLFNQMADMDIDMFETLRLLLVGGDVLSPAHINRVRQRCPDLAVVNGYGPTENTTFSCTYRIEHEFRESIPIGRPIANSTAYVLDKNRRPVPVGVVGELCLGGDGLSRGYLNRPELTGDTFIADPFTGEGRLYLTGDLARWLSDGNIEFIGRVDHQLKIRGYRIEPGEIENRLREIPNLQEVVVLARESRQGEKILYAYVVADRHVDVTEVRGRLLRQFPDYMVPSFIVPIDRIPLTPNGKVDRRALPEPDLQELGTAYTAPRSDTERRLASLWGEVLGLESSVIGIDADFFELGGHSLRATTLIARIHKKMNVKIPLAQIFKTPTIREISAYIREAGEEKFAAVEPAERREYYTLSSTQRRLYVLQQLQADQTAYNTLQVVVLEGAVDKERLEQAFRGLIERHESLRTTFELIDEHYYQRIHPAAVVLLDIQYIEAAEDEAGDIIKGFSRPFDLGTLPLLRVGLIKISASRRLLLVDMHHIITDGTSISILVREFLALYEGRSLLPLRLQYKDYSRWQQRLFASPEFKGQEQYWLNEFSDPVPVLNLPTDYPRPAVQSFAGHLVGFELEDGDSKMLRELAARQDVTAFMILLAAYNLFLRRLSGQEDIVVGTPIAGRRHAHLQNIIGMFINTLALRNRPLGELTFSRFLQEIKERTVSAFENQEYPFEDLVERVRVRRDTSRNPLFDAMLLFQNYQVYDGDVPKIEAAALKLRPYEYKIRTSKFDLTLYGREAGPRFTFAFEFCTRLFKRGTVNRWIGYFKTLIASILENPEQELASIEIIPAPERRRLLEAFNDTAVDYPRGHTLHRLLDKQAQRRPAAAALVFDHHHLTYTGLSVNSGRLAGYLGKAGVAPGQVVGLMPERSLEMMVGLFGVLKAGGAYLPIGPEYPPGRIQYMLKHSRTRLLLVTRPDTTGFEGLTVDLNDPAAYPHDSTSETPRTAAGDLAYVSYTSGSTGRPKGVMIEHRAVVNFIKGITDIIGFQPGDAVFSLTTLSFDIFGLETILPLTRGCRVVIGCAPEQTDGLAAAAALKRHCISIFQVTPSRLQLLVSVGEAARSLGGLTYLLVGGEAFPPLLLETARKYTKARIYNLYGPTETTIWSTLSEVTAAAVPDIGGPIANTRIYILNSRRKLQPVGVPGELWIAGDGVARGYLFNRKLTDQKFADDPFASAGRMYHTGDLARWLPDGRIEFLGRLDHQVKIRGFRIELGEIESRLLRHDRIAEGVVVMRETDGGSGGWDRYLCAYYVPSNPAGSGGIETAGLREFLAAELPEYMIPHYFIPLLRIPLTPNGKIDRLALPAPEADGGGVYTSPRNERERIVAGIWAEVLGLGPDTPSIDDNFFALGGHSLKATVMTARIHRELGVRIPLADVIKAPTIRGLSACIETAFPEAPVTVEPVERREFYPLSSAQKRLYIVMQTMGQNTAYNMPQLYKPETGPDRSRLQQTFNRLIRRHEALRTSFRMVEDEPVQRVHDNVDIEIEYIEAAEGQSDPHSLIRDFIRPFDLSLPPLLRVGLIAAEEAAILAVDVHHIVSDGISQAVLMNDFISLYAHRPLPLLKLHYKDYSRWQNNERDGGTLREQETYWLTVFSGEVPRLNLPLDFARPPVQDYAGDLWGFEIGREETAAVRRLCLEEKTTLFIFLLSIYFILMARLCGQQDIVIGTPVAGRRHADLEPVVGILVNTLALRQYPAEEKTFRTFLEEVKTDTLEALENQEYPFEDLVEAVVEVKDTSRNPLFDVMFSMADFDREASAQVDDTPGLRLKPYLEFRQKITHFDLLLFAHEGRETIGMAFEYSTALFKEATIREFHHYFLDILKQVAAHRDILLKEITLSHDLLTASVNILEGDHDEYEF